MTTQEEYSAVNVLKEKFKDFPKGELKKSESPDFIVADGSKIIGIETTQAVHSEKDKQVSSERITFTDLVIGKLVPLLPFHFSLSVTLDKTKPIRKSNRNEIANLVAIFCSTEFRNIKNGTGEGVENIEFDIEGSPEFIKNDMLANGYRNLPEGVASIDIFRFDQHGSSYNSASEAAAIPTFSKERLDKALIDKENKLSSYQVCDEYWLIIWQGGGITGYFEEIDFETPISTAFDKVFIVRSFDNDFIVLKG